MRVHRSHRKLKIDQNFKGCLTDGPKKSWGMNGLKGNAELKKIEGPSSALIESGQGWGSLSEACDCNRHKEQSIFMYQKDQCAWPPGAEIIRTGGGRLDASALSKNVRAEINRTTIRLVGSKGGGDLSK